MVEAHRAANQMGRRTATAVTQDFVAVADLLARQVEQLRGAAAGHAAEPMALPVRHQREFARLQQMRLRTVDLEPALPRSHDMEHQPVFHRR